MSLEQYYGVLGLKPGASEQEVKNAYRDLAKVWHPDRFAHDARLQQKAQEKLKEINEAFEAINSPASGRRQRARRPTPPAPPSSTSTSSPRTPRGGPADFASVAARRGEARASRLTPVAFAAAAVVITFFVSYRLLNSDTAAPGGVSPQAASRPGDEQRAEEGSDAGERRERKASGKQPRAGESAGAGGGSGDTTPSGARESAPAYKALPTVNRTIDPTTGLLATRACPLKALRTFADGQEPQKFCDADHSRKSANAPPQPPPSAPAPAQTAAQPATQPAAPPQTKGKSRLKSVIGAVASPGKLFRKKETPRGETKTGAGQE
jgi:hypothetical protein